MYGNMGNKIKKFCPSVMCPDSYIQDPETCQCRPVARTVSTDLAENLIRFKGLLDELCNTIPQLMKDDVCPSFTRAKNSMGFGF